MNPLLVSLFPVLKNSEKVRHREPAAIVEEIRADPRLRDLVVRVRNASDETQDQIKKTLPLVLWSGTFRKRDDESLETYSGLICFDFDDVPDPRAIRDKLAKYPSVFAAFISPTGTGVKAVVRVESKSEFHSIVERAIAKRLGTDLGHTADPKAMGISRACFLSHDPDAYLNTDAVPFDLSQDTGREGGPDDAASPPTLSLPKTADGGGVTQKHRSTEIQETQEAQETHVVSLPSPRGDMDLAWVDKHLPTAPHQTNNLLFNLARDVLAQEKRHGRTFTPAERLAVFDRWFSLSRPEFLTHSREVYLEEFLLKRRYAKKPLDESPLQVAWITSGTRPPPPETQGLGDGTRRLASFCRELAIANDPKPFFLSCHAAAGLLNVTPTTAHRYLSRLVGLGLLDELEKGSSKEHKATSFLYRGSR